MRAQKLESSGPYQPLLNLTAVNRQRRDLMWCVQVCVWNNTCWLENSEVGGVLGAWPVTSILEWSFTKQVGSLAKEGEPCELVSSVVSCVFPPLTCLQQATVAEPGEEQKAGTGGKMTAIEVAAMEQKMHLGGGRCEGQEGVIKRYGSKGGGSLKVMRSWWQEKE